MNSNNRAHSCGTIRKIAQPYGTTCGGGAQKRRPSGWRSTARFLLALTIVALTSVALAPAASAGQIINGRTGTAYTALQDAVNDALPGDTLVVKGTCVGTSTIDRNLQLQGAGQATLDGSSFGTSVIEVDFGVTVEINGLTITHGGSFTAGGGIFNRGTLAINNSTIRDNVVETLFGGGFGGGIVNGFFATLTINNSTIRDNMVAALLSGFSSGGGISNSGMLTINNSTVEGNVATGAPFAFGGGFGGGISNSGTLTINNSSISDNGASTDGGGIYGPSDFLDLTNSTVSGNFPDDIAP